MASVKNVVINRDDFFPATYGGNGGKDRHKFYGSAVLVTDGGNEFPFDFIYESMTETLAVSRVTPWIQQVDGSLLSFCNVA